MDWPQLLPTIAASIRFSVVSSTGVSPFYALYGVAPRMSFEWDYFHPDKECPPKQLEIALRYAGKSIPYPHGSTVCTYHAAA
jgi:hypothetical protein